MDEMKGTAFELVDEKVVCIFSFSYRDEYTFLALLSSLSLAHFSIGMFLLWLGFGLSMSLMGQLCLSAHDQASGPY